MVGILLGVIPLFSVNYFHNLFFWLFWLVSFLFGLVLLIQRLLFKKQLDKISFQVMVFTLSFVLPIIAYFCYAKSKAVIYERSMHHRAKNVIQLLEIYKIRKQLYPMSLNELNEPALIENISYSVDQKRVYFELYYPQSKPYVEMRYYSDGRWKEINYE